MRAVYLTLALMGSAAVDATTMDGGISGGDVLARCQALLLASSPSTASASAYSQLAESSLPSDITVALETHSLQWAKLPDLARVGLLWAHGYVVNSVADSVALVKVYTSCGATDSSVAASEDARGLTMDQISLSSSAFASAQCLSNTCGVYHQSTNTNCGSDLPAHLLCAVEHISSSANSVPTATGSFWSDAGDDSTEAPFPQIYSHTVPVARNVTTGSSVPSDVTLTSIHMTTKGVNASPSCSTTGDTVIPCLQLTSGSSAGSRAFCRPQIDAARLEAFLTATKTQVQKSSSSEATTISTGATDGSSSSSGLSTGAILGIAGGALVVLGILAFYFLRRKKTQGDGYHADRDGGGGGFGRKSVGPRASGNGPRPANGGNANVNGNGVGNDDKMRATPFGRNDSTFPIIDRAADNESVISTDYYQDNKQDGDNQRPRATSRPPYLSKNTSGSSGGSSRGAMYGKTVEEYSEESETIREFLADPQILMRRIPYEELTPLRLLSKGSYGEVFLAQLETRHVATKRLLPEKKTLTRSIEQFTAEIQLMCQLEHRNIVSFVGVSWDHLQNLSAVVEYMDNGDLAEVLARSKGRFTWQKEKISISMDVAEGLVYLHSMRPVVVHRDLKSKNVLLNKRGQAKLSDFGVSRKTTVNETMTSGVGTLLWTAPEIIEGRKYSEKADIFSLGVVLSEIDTCDMPYAGVTDEYGDRLPGMQIVQMVRLGELKVSLELDCPPRLRELVLQCTSLDPDLRPTSMEVAYTLKSIIAPSLRV